MQLNEPHSPYFHPVPVENHHPRLHHERPAFRTQPCPPRTPPNHDTNRDKRSGKAAPSRTASGSKAWVTRFASSDVFQSMRPGVIPEIRLITRSRFADKNIHTIAPTVTTTTAQLNHNR